MLVFYLDKNAFGIYYLSNGYSDFFSELSI